MSAPVASPTAVDLYEKDSVLGGRRPLVDSEMDITPMIDCVFLLLIFFVVCSTLDSQTSINLAEARHGKGVSERDAIIITVGTGGIDQAPIYLTDGVDVAPLPTDPEQQRARIEEYVQREMRNGLKSDVLIKADRNVAHRDVARVIRAVSRTDGLQLHLAVMEAQQ